MLQVVDRKVEVEEGRRRGLESLFDTLLRDLLTGKLRVTDLTVTEPAGAV